MITAGVDLATQPAKTGLAVLEWTADAARVVELRLGATDDDLVDVALRCAKVGVDCPLGWPDEFVRFVAGHAQGRLDVPAASGDALRRRLALRETDRVLAAAGSTPLSVSSDRIALTAVRCAVVLDRLAAAGAPVDRSGGGVVAEVYPAASLRRWGLPHRGYKRAENRAARVDLLRGLRERAPWLDLGGHEALCVEQDDALDAVVAALVARAAALGRCAPPPPEHLERARREGWVLLPDADLASLNAPGGRSGTGPGSRPGSTPPAPAPPA